MKFRFLYLILALTIIASCNKKLDVLPQQSIPPDEIKTEEDLKAVLSGGYALLQSSSAFGERFLFIPDLLASDSQVIFVGTFTNYKQVQRKQTLANNSIASGIWANAYELILDVNTVLDKIALATTDKDVIEGEAKFIRGITYFELVNLYAKPYSAGNVNDAANNPGVPIILAPVYEYDSTRDKPSRASIQEVYNQVISDLNDAVAKLPSDPQETSNGLQVRASRYSAEAFLVRVYMNMGDYASAATLADNIIGSNKYFLSSFDKAFNNDAFSSEDIFDIAQSNQSNAGTSNSGIPTFYAAQPAGRGDAQVDPNYGFLFDNSDVRGQFFYQGVSIGGYSGFYTGKWSKIYKYIPVVRLAEMYLSRGEANLMIGGVGSDLNTPLDDINVVRDRSGANLLVTVTQQDFVEERFRELGFEGDRLWTLKRLQLDVDGRPFDDNKLVLPIPQREMDVNKNLVQNPGF